MQNIKKTIALVLAAIVLATVLSGCSSTRSENGVSIKQDRNAGSLKFW